MKKIILAAVTVVLAVVLAFFLYNARKNNREQTEHLREVHEKAAPYEKERDDLQSELDELKRKITEVSAGYSVICYRITEASDIDMVKKHADSFSLTPVLLIDCTSDEALTEAAKKTGYEIILTSDPFNIKDAADKIAASEITTVLLRKDYDTDKNRNALKEAGCTQLVCHADVIYEGKNDLPSISYSYVDSDKVSILSRISGLADNGGAIVFVFDMEGVKNGVLTENSILSNLYTINEKVKRGHMYFKTLAEAEEHLKNAEKLKEENQKEYDKKFEESNKRIKELDKIISEIYSKWNRED